MPRNLTLAALAEALGPERNRVPASLKCDLSRWSTHDGLPCDQVAGKKLFDVDEVRRWLLANKPIRASATTARAYAPPVAAVAVRAASDVKADECLRLIEPILLQLGAEFGIRFVSPSVSAVADGLAVGVVYHLGGELRFEDVREAAETAAAAVQLALNEGVIVRRLVVQFDGFNRPGKYQGED